jgi:hypothetical protein
VTILVRPILQKVKKMTINSLIAEIQSNLTDDLLKPEWRCLRRPTDHPTFGHCYVATEVLYHLYGKRHGFKPHRIGNHWFLKNPETNEILDPTKEQFDHPLNYSFAKGCGFLTRQPSRRARTLLKNLSKTS